MAMTQPDKAKHKALDKYNNIQMMQPKTAEHPEPKLVTVKADKRDDYAKKGYKYVGRKEYKPTLTKNKKTKATIATKDAKEVVVGPKNEENEMNKLVKLFKLVEETLKEKEILLDTNFEEELPEDDEYWKEEMFAGDDKEDDEETPKNEADDELEEQNMTGAIAGYNMPIGSRRPGVTDVKEPYDLLDEPGEKAKIKSLDMGPNKDRTYNKFNWDKINNKHNEEFMPLNLHNIFEYTPLTSSERTARAKTAKTNASKTNTPAKQYYKKNKTKIKTATKKYAAKNKTNIAKTQKKVAATKPKTS